MIGSEIREIVAARTVPVICAAFNETTVQIWDVAAQRRIGEFSARYSFGSRNLAMHPDGECIVTGAPAKKGYIASYTVPDGELLWLRETVLYSAYVRFGHLGKCVSFTIDNRRVEKVDSRTGVTVEALRNVCEYFELSNKLTLEAFVRGTSYMLRGDHEILIPMVTFAILDATFGVDSICISESTGPLRSIDWRTGIECWRYTPPDGSHVLRLHYNYLDGFFYGVLWHYEKGRFRYLMRFDPQTGETAHICNLNSWAEVFSEATQQLVTSSGEIVDLSSGKLVGKLAFPLKEYPDRFTLA